MKFDDKNKTFVAEPKDMMIKSWWSGDPRVEPYMQDVRKAIERNIPGGCTDIYNRSYEAVYKAITDYADKKKVIGEV